MKERPLSPHLQVYRWEWTMFYSISHRASGVFLSLGALLVVAWLFSLASGEVQFTAMQNLMSSIYGKVALFFWSWALFYHLVNGLRHLVWDTGLMMSLRAGQYSGHIGFTVSILLNFVLWFFWGVL